MEIAIRQGDLLAAACDAVIVPASSADGKLVLGEAAKALDASLDGELTRLAADARYTGARGAALVVPTLGRVPARRIVLAGIGSDANVTEETLRRAWGAAATAARDHGAASICSALPPAGMLDQTVALAAAVAGARMATYRYAHYYGAAKNRKPHQESDTLSFVGDVDRATADAALQRGEGIAGGVNLARDLTNQPASDLHPMTMVDAARAVADAHGLEMRVIGPDELEQMGAGSILAVGKGSVHPPLMIHLTWRPDPKVASKRKVGLVGKCITFDTGGYSIKTYEGMLEMKGDMAGGAAVLGAMSALDAIGCRHEVHGVICAAENMISGEAMRPGDVLRASNGVTIEVLSTDAEGRLVLADGLVYTARQGVDEMIDLATLTGAKVVALGDETTALFSNNDRVAGGLLDAAGEAGELLWRMPLTEELEDQIRGEIGDIRNTGGRAGGSITAALFLQHFSEGLPWAHLDIAGGNRTSKGKPYTPKGSTGVGVRTLLAYLGQD